MWEKKQIFDRQPHIISCFNHVNYFDYLVVLCAIKTLSIGEPVYTDANLNKKQRVAGLTERVRQKKHLCDKKMVSKTKLEDFIVHKTMTFLQDNDVIERLSELLFKLQYSESTMLPHLEEQLSDKEKEIENIVNAVQKGYATDTLLKRLGELEKQRNEINDSITKEKLKSPIFTQEHFKMALCNFRKIDITKQDGKRKIIDTFINSIFLYDDHLKIVYNGNGKEETITLDELESSTLFSQGAPKPLQ